MLEMDPNEARAIKTGTGAGATKDAAREPIQNGLLRRYPIVITTAVAC